MPSTGNHTFNTGTELWVRVGGGDDFTAAASGAGSLGGLLSGTGTGTSTVTYSGDVDLILLRRSPRTTPATFPIWGAAARPRTSGSLMAA